MRVNIGLKLHSLFARLDGDPREIEVNQHEYAQKTATGNVIDPGCGILYWIEFVGTTDGGNGRAYDGGAAVGKELGAGYITKAPHSVINSYDPPQRYDSGIYAALTNATAKICYRPTGRNLLCRVTIEFHAVGKDLVARLIVRKMTSKNLVNRLIVKKYTTKDLVNRLITLKATSKNMPVKLVVLKATTKNLVSQVNVVYAASTLDLVSRITVLKPTSKDLVSRVTTLKPTSRNLQCQVHVQWIAP